MTMERDFMWGSPLGGSVILFLLSGALWILIGVLAPLMHDSAVGRQLLVMSPRTDSVVFGGSPPDLLREQPNLATLRTIIFQMLSGMLVSAGGLEMVVTWFGL